MALEDFFDTTVRFWRPVEVTGKLREKSRAYVPVTAAPAAPNAVVNRPVAPLVDVGTGLAAEGRRRFYMDPGTDVRERDVAEFVAGPDAPSTWEVDNPPSRPENDHMQLDCRAFRGQLVPDES